MNSKAIIQILDHLGSEYSKKWTPKEKNLKIKTWSTILADVTDEQAMGGLRKALESPGEFMPPVGKFKEMCLSAAGCHSLEDEATMAWDLAINNTNPYACAVFKNAVIAETIREMGGWVKFSSMLTADKPFRKRDFTGIYAVLKRRGRNYSPLLMGIHGVTGSIGQDYRKFIGYEPEDDMAAVMLENENKPQIHPEIVKKLAGGA